VKHSPPALTAYRVPDDDDLVVFFWQTEEQRAAAALSPAEREVLELLAAGHTNAEIARRRRSSVRTVANQVASIFRRLGVGSRAQLAAALSRRPRSR
jgi:DNA-binding NarL/FixJ family response regulator